jgi:SAM-dependent methyltransferase
MTTRSSTMPAPTTQRYVPAAGRGWLTGLYDPIMALTMRERAFRPAIIDAVLADPRPGVVLDVGCGTGTLARQLATADPSVRVVGIDGDERVLTLAREKVQRFDERVRFIKGLADDLPVEDATVDVVVASLLLHHLSRIAKQEALREARRVLTPAGRLVIADWGQPHDPLTRAGFLALRLLDGLANTRDHAAGRLPSLVTQVGFSNVRIRQSWRTMWGSLDLITAKPTSETVTSR